jgi:toxin ParE1/3/4
MDTAEKVVREISEVVDVLAEHPQAGRKRNEVRYGLRSLAASPHVIFYRVTNNIPEIIRVLDGRQDIDEKFTEK